MVVKLKPKETIVIAVDKATKKKIAYTGLYIHGQSRHLNVEYDVISDEIGSDGSRSIKMDPRDTKDRDRMQEEIINEVLKQLGEEKSKNMKKLLQDTFSDNTEYYIDKLWKKLFEKNFKVRAGEGCFKLIFGDGRKKNHEEVMLRE